MARRHPDTGGYWSRVLVATAWPLVLMLMVSRLLQPLAPNWWHPGWHALSDLLAPADQTRHLLALLGPLGFWLLLLIGIGFTRLDAPGTGRWLAGSLGSGGSRAWLFWLAGLPLLLLGGFALPLPEGGRLRALSAIPGLVLGHGRSDHDGGQPRRRARGSGAGAAAVMDIFGRTSL